MRGAARMGTTFQFANQPLLAVNPLPLKQPSGQTGEGTCDARFQGVKEAFTQNFADYGEVGAAVAGIVDGRMAVDLRSRPRGRRALPPVAA